MSEITIVPAEEGHIPAICAIALRAWAGIWSVYRQELGDEAFETCYAGWEKRKSDAVTADMRSGRGYAALLDGRVVGFISYAVKPGMPEVGVIGNNAVDPEARGHGVGPKMYAFILDKMRQEGLRYAQVTTGLDDGHAPARRAYAKAGFEKGLGSITYTRKL